MTECTVEKYVAVLVSKVTQFDQKLSAKEEARHGRANIYRLGHYLKATQKVERAVASVKHRSDLNAILKLLDAVGDAFEHDFPPARNLARQIEKGTCSLVK